MNNFSFTNELPNFNVIEIGSLTIYVSYTTPIAFRYKGDLVIRQNDWAQTTGNHLNTIDSDKSIRISGDDFEEKLSKIIDNI